MWPFKRPKPLPPGGTGHVSEGVQEVLETLPVLWERFEQAEKDIINLNTALNRVERKQSRWLEILNEKANPADVAKLEETNPGNRSTEEDLVGAEIEGYEGGR